LAVSKLAVANFVQALVAVLAGNAAYFLLLPHLPPPARHMPQHVDLGMLVDFWLCLVIFGAIKTVAGRKNKPDSGSASRHNP
jgi:hypothetical protein